MKKHICAFLAFCLLFCGLYGSTSAAASSSSVTASYKSSVEDALATSQNAKEIYHFLIYNMGLNSAAACGVMANIRRESYFNPETLGDYGTSYGICQWHDTSTGKGRYTNLINWCTANGYDYTTLTGQLYFLWHELSQNDSTILYNGKTIYETLLAIPNTAEGAYSAGYYWCNYFEVPYSNNPERRAAECDTRGILARDTYWPAYSEPTLGDTCYTTDGIQISWESFGGAIRYEMYRYTDGDASTTELVGTTLDTTFTDTTVESGKTYTYILCAIMLQADGTTLPVNAKETSLYYLGAPVITKCTGTSTGQKLTWTAVNGATQYIICRSDDDGEYIQIAETSELTFKDTDAISSGVHYSYQMYACRNDGTGNAMYSLVSNTIDNYTLDKPAITSISSTDDGIKIKWDKVENASYYTISRSIGGGDYEEIATVTKKSYTDTDVSTGSSIKYKVYAHYTGELGQTSKSAGSAAQKTYFVKTPNLKSVTSSKSSTIVPKWSRNKNATGYEIQYSTKKSFKSNCNSLLIVTNDTTSWSIKNLKKGTTYYVRVRSYVKKNGKKIYSAWSSTLSCKAK